MYPMENIVAKHPTLFKWTAFPYFIYCYYVLQYDIILLYHNLSSPIVFTIASDIIIFAIVIVS